MSKIHFLNNGDQFFWAGERYLSGIASLKKEVVVYLTAAERSHVKTRELLGIRIDRCVWHKRKIVFCSKDNTHVVLREENVLLGTLPGKLKTNFSC